MWNEFIIEKHESFKSCAPSPSPNVIMFRLRIREKFAARMFSLWSAKLFAEKSSHLYGG